MFNVPLANTEANTIPTVDALGDTFEYRQLSLIMNPVLTSNGSIANGVNYDMTTQITVSSNSPFQMNDIVYQSSDGTYPNAFWHGTVVWFDSVNLILHINNQNGSFAPQSALYGTHNTASNPYTSVIAFTATAAPITPFSGDVLYIENRSAIQRAVGQEEDIKLIIAF
jgi:hypothetical protein